MTKLDRKLRRNQKLLPEISADEIVSRPMALFIRDFQETISAFFFSVRLAGQLDEIKITAKRALASPEEAEQIVDEPEIGDTVKALSRYSYQNSRALTSGIVDNFQCYCSELLQEVMQNRPEIMSSSKETITVSDIISKGSYDDIIAYVIDKKINELAYGGLRAIEDYIRDRLGIEMFEDTNKKMMLSAFIELRNIQTHNRGRVNATFRNRMKENEFLKTDYDGRISLGFDKFAKFSANCLEIALFLDRKTSKKFDLECREYKHWEGDLPQ